MKVLKIGGWVSAIIIPIIATLASFDKIEPEAEAYQFILLITSLFLFTSYVKEKTWKPVLNELRIIIVALIILI